MLTDVYEQKAGGSAKLLQEERCNVEVDSKKSLSQFMREMQDLQMQLYSLKNTLENLNEKLNGRVELNGLAAANKAENPEPKSLIDGLYKIQYDYYSTIQDIAINITALKDAIGDVTYHA